MFNIFNKNKPKIILTNPDLQIFQNKDIALEYPKDWLKSDQEGIINLYPKDNYGAVTISIYHDIDFPIEKTKEFILGMNKIEDNLEKVTMKEKGEIIEFNYEHVDKDIRWITRVLRKGTNLYLITTNCNTNRWDNEKFFFLKILDSVVL